MNPLGLAHLFATGHHYGPAPWICDLARPEWNPCYYHRAEADGVGFDRTARGSNALTQYAASAASQWIDPRTIDPDYLLWFHHVPWDFPMASGRPLWNELVSRYDRGVTAVERMAAIWEAQQPHVDPERFADVSDYLRIQRNEARWWRDASIAYWQSVNGLELPQDTRPPEHSLDHYKSLTFSEAPGN
jgi:alpha-glucuronidase